MLDKKLRKNLSVFSKYVEEYCTLIENRDSFSFEEFIGKLAIILPSLYKCAAEFPVIWTDSDDLIRDHVTSEMAAKVSRDLDAKLDKYSWYWHVYDPYAGRGYDATGRCRS